MLILHYIVGVLLYSLLLSLLKYDNPVYLEFKLDRVKLLNENTMREIITSATMMRFIHAILHEALRKQRDFVYLVLGHNIYIQETYDTLLSSTNSSYFPK